jgi:hypothetical protein
MGIILQAIGNREQSIIGLLLKALFHLVLF